MKKLVLAMACVLSLGLLASCKQGVQDVNLQNQEKTEGFDFFGTVVVAADPVSLDTTAHAYKSTSSTTDGFVVDGFATVSWTKAADTVTSNYKSFTIKFSGATDNNTSDTAKPSSYSDKTVTVYVINNEYYVKSSDVDANNNVTTGKTKLTLSSGDPETGSFTLTGFGVTSENIDLSISSIAFTAF